MADIAIITNVSGLGEMEATLNADRKKIAVKLLRATGKTAAKVYRSTSFGRRVCPIDSGFLADQIGRQRILARTKALPDNQHVLLVLGRHRHNVGWEYGRYIDLDGL